MRRRGKGGKVRGKREKMGKWVGRSDDNKGFLRPTRRVLRRPSCKQCQVNFLGTRALEQHLYARKGGDFSKLGAIALG